VTGEGEGSSNRIMGAILAGGASRRYGSPKALAPLAGRPMATWASDALRPHASFLGVLTGDPAVTKALGVPGRLDSIPGQGPLGGLLTALSWAREEGVQEVFLLACDLPLVDETLVGRILDHGLHGRKAVVPASLGPLGLEPLCAAYTVDCLESAHGLVAAGRRSMMGLLDQVGYALVPVEVLGGREEVALRFRNVNTKEDRSEVEEILREGMPS